MKTPGNPPPVTNLPREEWDFRPRFQNYDDRKFGPFSFLSEDEVAYCNFYEIDRQSADVKSALTHRGSCAEWLNWQRLNGGEKLSIPERDTLRAKTFDALLAQHYHTNPGEPKATPPLMNWFHLVWPEWPARPYLSVPWKERKRRFGIMWGNEKPRTLRLVRLADIYRDIAKWKRRKRPSQKGYWAPRFVLQAGMDVWTVRSRRPKHEEVILEIAAVEIDYTLSNKVLIRRFENLLKQRRKQKGYHEHGTRNLRLETKAMRAELVALGAGRLVRSGLTYGEAADYSARVTGRPLYAHPPAWSDAVVSVRDYIGNV